MAVREYQCRLMRQQGAFSGGRWERDAEPVPVRIDLSSTPSKMNALLFAMRQRRRREDLIERFRLEVLDDNGDTFATINASLPELELHNAGYPVSASGYADGDGDGSVSLASASNEQLIAELRRRLGAGY